MIHLLFVYNVMNFS